MWNVALTTVIFTAADNAAITSQKYCMTKACSNLGVCETLLVNYPQMSSARGRALSEQRRHPIHRAKKPWTNTKRPASNQPQNKRVETQAIANDINSKSCRDQHSTLRAMPKFPNGSLHKNKPSMNTIHVSIHQPGCMTIPQPRVGCRIVLCHSIRTPRHFHHFIEALYEDSLQKPGCIACLSKPKVECNIGQPCPNRKLQLFHAFPSWFRNTEWAQPEAIWRHEQKGGIWHCFAPLSP